MKLYKIQDVQMGIPAFHVLAPSEYKLNGSVTWNNALANLVTADVAIVSPDQSVGFYVHPAPLYISGVIERQWPAGQWYLGMMVTPMPNSPAEFLQKMLLPQRRPKAQNIQLVKQTELREWANSIALQNAQPGTNFQGFGVCARFSYTENGQQWEEDFYCVVLVSSPQMGLQNYRWLADRNLSVRAHAGKLNALEPVAKTFVNSFRVEKRWFGRHKQIQGQWIAAQQQGINNAGTLSRIISQANDHFDQTIVQSWNARQQADDRASREFSEYMRDSENYNDPVNDLQVELPGGYEQVCTNVNGEYILSNEPGFNPNRNSNIDWSEIQRIP